MKKSLFRILLGLVCMAGFSACADQSPYPPLHFAVLTDIHVLPGAESSTHLMDIVAEINKSQLDFVVITGDLTNQGSREELLNVKRILDQLTLPLFVIPGNHETNWSESAGRDFIEIFGDDRFVEQMENYLLLGINTGPFMRMGDGHVKEEDIRWLERTLKSRSSRNTRILFFAHYPLAEGLDQWYRITDILKEFPVIASFCGHGHMQQLMNFDGIPGIMGRSTVLRGGSQPGYNLVSIVNDSVKVFEKITDEDKGAPDFVFSVYDHEFLADIPVSARPDFSVNELYPHISPVFHWRDTASVFTGARIVGDSLAIFGNSVGIMRALRLEDSTTLWEVPLEGPLFSTPALARSSHIIGGDNRGMVYSMDVNTGRKHWSLATPGPIVAPPVIEGEFIYQGVGKSGMYKISAATGEVVWIFPHVDGLIQAEPVIHYDHLLFTAWDTHLYCLNKHTGELLWQWNNGRPVNLLSPGNVVPAVAHNKVFLVAPDRVMTALDLRTGEQIWRTARHQVRESMGLSQDRELVYAKLMNDSIIAVKTRPEEMVTFRVLDAGFGYDHNPVPVHSENGRVYTATRNELIIAMDKALHQVLWKHKTGNSAVNFFSTGKTEHLWFTTANGQLIALPSPPPD